MKLKFDSDSFDDALMEAVAKAAFRGKEPTDAEMAKWVKSNRDRLVCDIEVALTGIVHRIQNPPQPVTAPVLRFKYAPGGSAEIRLWAIDAHCRAKLADHRSFEFGGDDTASLVYEETCHGHRATEHSMSEPSIWDWIQDLMERGMAVQRLAKLSVSEESTEKLPVDLVVAMSLCTTRRDVQILAARAGYKTHIGGHHVSIMKPNTEIRLALVTNPGKELPDFN